MDLKIFTSSITQISEEKGISKEKVVEIIEQAFAAAYKKDYGKKGQIIKAKLSSKTGDVKFWQIKLVVAEDEIYSEQELEELKNQEEEREDEKIRFNPEKHILLKDAKKIDSKIKKGEDLEIRLETKQDYGRIAAQTAKQVILQRIREAERNTIFEEYKDKEGEIISGIVQRIEEGKVFLDIGKGLGILPREEQIQGEFYRYGQRFKLYVMKVDEGAKGPLIILSRSYPKMLSKLFELEVPEIQAGDVVIKSIAREPGSRSKIAVSAKADGVDPIGAMVGQKGTRVMAVINELGGEKVDIIEYSDKSEKYISNSLSPAKVMEVRIMPKNKAMVIVPEDQLSLAIGKEGQNVRLAAQLTGWKIDVRSGEETGGKEEKEEKEEKEKEKTSKKKTTKAKKID
ncbi:transcription termination/antitermination protein NusA [Candidatus Parcubacteria bacterium]|nr:transcription termination/antitermination protein NusA [Candidatus Parcubacteria bacterium]